MLFMYKSVQQIRKRDGRIVPFNPEKTLYVKRSYITEFMPFITNYEDYLALPGIIPPAEEEEFFIKILSGMTLFE